jgi:uncharacterized membrane protein
MPRFSSNQKYRASQIAIVVSFAVVAYCLSHMSPFKEARENQIWFGLLIAAVIISMPFFVAFYYYRARRKNDTNDTILIETLAHSGRPELNKTGTKNSRERT